MPAVSPERSLIFQEASLYPWLTVKDNVTFGLRIAGKSPREMNEAAERILRFVGLAGAGNKRSHELSGAMRQRAALTRGLATKPKVLLMAEPFAALDIQTRARMQKHLLDIWESSRAADLNLIDLGALPFVPLNNLHRQLVHCELDSRSLCPWPLARSSRSRVSCCASTRRRFSKRPRSSSPTSGRRWTVLTRRSRAIFQPIALCTIKPRP
ncbi:ATP-binding cassette domain-containing protein [Citreicella sp. C3M06]|uniref:ATP-binding cassette domain-containing protein n=1 Tax=Citreicella sp. C3M06 TaxID=2841564 RepID=UPI001C099F2E|nr:ATP-binding cassette domain-containing protein [Citreicella sp. C3M06]MBU2960069.1 ATP-binding cassette domain-containing protein [Citreicella sp. C3M06]